MPAVALVAEAYRHRNELGVGLMRPSPRRIITGINHGNRHMKVLIFFTLVTLGITDGLGFAITFYPAIVIINIIEQLAREAPPLPRVRSEAARLRATPGRSRPRIAGQPEAGTQAAGRRALVKAAPRYLVELGLRQCNGAGLQHYVRTLLGSQTHNGHDTDQRYGKNHYGDHHLDDGETALLLSVHSCPRRHTRQVTHTLSRLPCR